MRQATEHQSGSRLDTLGIKQTGKDGKTVQGKIASIVQAQRNCGYWIAKAKLYTKMSKEDERERRCEGRKESRPVSCSADAYQIASALARPVPAMRLSSCKQGTRAAVTDEADGMMDMKG